MSDIAGIKFHYESDGDTGNRTFYVIAEHDDWSDCKRLDFDYYASETTRRKHAIAIAGQLKIGEITMSEAAAYARSKWF